MEPSEEVPNPFRTPCFEIDHRRPGFDPRSPRGVRVVLFHGLCSPTSDLLNRIGQHVRTVHRRGKIQIAGWPPPRDRDGMLRQHRAGVRLRRCLVDRHPTHPIIVIVGPEKWVGTAVSREQRGVQVQRATSRDGENLAGDEPGKRRDANEVGIGALDGFHEFFGLLTVEPNRRNAGRPRPIPHVVAVAQTRPPSDPPGEASYEGDNIRRAAYDRNFVIPSERAQCVER